MEQRKMDADRLYTFADYQSWPDDVRGELIRGVFYDMAPAPSPSHQALSGYLFMELGNYLKGKPCKPFYAPTDVYFTEDDGTNTVVQPDILVVCKKAQITDKGILGAPRFIIEIVSPSNADHDYSTKRKLYQRQGVEEYWIVSPMAQSISRHVLANGIFAITAIDSGSIESAVFPGFHVELDALFGYMEFDSYIS